MNTAALLVLGIVALALAVDVWRLHRKARRAGERLAGPTERRRL